MRSLMICICIVLHVVSPCHAKDGAVEARNGMVVCVSPAAADVGVAILKKGGTAVDATVAVALAMAVTYPPAGNIGGGGFMLVYLGGNEKPIVFEYRETAPKAVNRESFVNEKSPHTHKAVGVPGTVRGMELAHKKFGKLPWKDVVMPAVKLAEEGFPLTDSMARSLNGMLKATKENAEFQRCFGKADGSPWKVGDILVQKDLGKTLRAIAVEGPNAFYTGLLAELLEKEMKTGGGFITKDDLAGYKANERVPIHGSYRGHDVYGASPPSSGGTCLVQMLNIMENFDVKKHERYSPETIHLMAEASRRAFCDRARWLGDPDFTKIPDHLATKEYAKKLAQGIDLKHATKSESLADDIPLGKDGDSTTHFSIIDSKGMAVSNTYTLENSYGSRVVVKGAGYLLNNEMFDFNWKPGVTTRTGGIGTKPNEIAPGKRMLSSQSPTIIAKDGKPLLITGSPGSRTIINTVFGIVVSVVDYGMDVQSAVDAPRMHHQWFPDEIRFEGVKEYPDLVKKLKEMGHKVEYSKQGDGHSIWIDPKTGTYRGAADKRIDGKAAGY
ncbi:MAG: gamma-glutamyltransferase [Planctomycetes bacterium]|nr:gamma-glutamyltransferase [Planctomycetota bacterium]